MNKRPNNGISGIESFVLFQNSQGENGRGTLIHLTRNNAVFETYNPYSIVQLSEVLKNLRIFRGERAIYSGKAVVNNLVPTGLMLIVSATLLDPWCDLVGLEPGKGLSEETKRFVEEWEQSNFVKPSYQLMISNIRNFLEELSRWLQPVEILNDVKDKSHKFLDHQFMFIKEVAEHIHYKLDELFKRFENESIQLATEEIPTHAAFAQRALHPLILCAPFIHRTFTKPLGYAGDYQMLNMIINNPWDGPSPYAKLLNSFFLNKDPSKAYHNRISMLCEIIKKEAQRTRKMGRPLQVLNIGCGPVNEIQRFVREDPLSEYCEFNLLDFNKETIEYAKSRLQEVSQETHRKVNLKFILKSIHSLLKEASSSMFTDQSYDLIYCAGLFDYFSNRVCKRLLELYFSWVRPGGLVVATNVKHSEPVLFFMEFLLDWHLIYRDEDEMLNLAPGLGVQNFQRDITDINIFLKIRKTNHDK